MDEAPFVERIFDGGEWAVRFYLPTKAEGGEYQCRWTIRRPDGEFARSTSGLDGLHALTLAMQASHFELIGTDAYKSGNLAWEQGDLNLPSDSNAATQ